MNKYTIIILIIIFIGLFSCQDYESVAPDTIITEVDKYDGTLLEYLSDEKNNAINHRFDSMLVVINAIPGLKEALAKEDQSYTIFALPNECFEASFKELNIYRTQKELGKELAFKDLFIEPFTVYDTIFFIGSTTEILRIDSSFYDYRSQVDTLICRYIFNEKYTTDDLFNSEKGNITAESFKFKYLMNMDYSSQMASGIEGEGNYQFTFNDMNYSQLKDRWNTTDVIHQDIYTRNAIIHILPKHHSFGYDKFTNYFKNRGNEYEKE